MKKTKQTDKGKKPTPRIIIDVHRIDTDRMAAITSLCDAVAELARSLRLAVHVDIRNSSFINDGRAPSVKLNGNDETETRTIIWEGETDNFDIE